MAKRGKSKCLEWLKANVGYGGADCLIWPFNRVRGYGTFKYLGQDFYATRFMCELAYGPEPIDGPRYTAAHSCGNGAGGCVNPRHLSWKTHEGNSADMLTHGTARSSRQKLTREDADRIRALSASMTQEALAIMFGVCAQNIRHILHGRTHVRPRTQPRRFLPDERALLVARAAEMRASHVTYDKIAAALGISRLSARTFVREANKLTVSES